MSLVNSSIPYDSTLEIDPQILELVGQLVKVFKNDAGDPFEHTPTQVKIIAIIIGRLFPRVQLILPTQYGKSDNVGQGVLLRASAKPERWLIVSSQKEKAEIIMGYIIKHTFDHPRFLNQLIFDEPLEKLRQHRSKEKLTFKVGANVSEVMVLSANARNTQETKKALMGFGSPNVILDESGLIPDDLYATIKRMVSGHKDNFLLEIGNPFFRNHFLRTWVRGLYARIWVDYNTAIAEGRYTKEMIDEMREEAFFDVLYECLFPDGNEVRPDGYRRLLTDAIIQLAMIRDRPEIAEGDSPILFVDVAAGGANQTVFALRWPLSGFIEILEKNNDDDLDNQAERIMMYKEHYQIDDYRIGIDDGGVGHGLGDILKNRYDLLFKRVLAGEKPHKHVPEGNLTRQQKQDRNRFANNKAMLNWRMRMWIKNGGELLYDEGFNELSVLSYKQTPGDKLMMEPKEKLAEQGIASPDTADAAAGTFMDTYPIGQNTDDDLFMD